MPANAVGMTIVSTSVVSQTIRNLIGGMPTLAVDMFRGNLAIHMPTTSVGMPPISPNLCKIQNAIYETLHESSQASQERGQVLLFLFVEFRFQHQVEEFTL
jgi:hypothetical protein